MRGKKLSLTSACRTVPSCISWVTPIKHEHTNGRNPRQWFSLTCTQRIQKMMYQHSRNEMKHEDMFPKQCIKKIEPNCADRTQSTTKGPLGQGSVTTTWESGGKSEGWGELWMPQPKTHHRSSIIRVMIKAINQKKRCIHTQQNNQNGIMHRIAYEETWSTWSDVNQRSIIGMDIWRGSKKSFVFQKKIQSKNKFLNEDVDRLFHLRTC